MRRSLLAVTLLLALTPSAAGAARPKWDTHVLARVGFPGYPAHPYAHPNGRIYEGTYVNSSSTVPSRVLEYDADGTVLRQWQMQGQALEGEQGVQVATSDSQGRLVLFDHSPPRALLLDTRTGAFTTYATFPEGSIPNYGAWGPAGELYVTDYGANQVWRVPPGGGAPAVWLTDPAFQTVEFGTTCITLAADHRTLLIGQQTSFNGVAGGLFRTRISDDGRPGPVTKLWTSGATDLPDGCAIAQDGRIFIAALGPNQIVQLSSDGVEQERWPPVPLLGENGTDVPFDALSGVVFRGTSLITASQSNPRGQAEHWALHDVEVQTEGLPTFIPPTAGVLPGEIVPGTALTVRSSVTRIRVGRTTRLRFTVTAQGRRVAGALVRFAGRTARTDAQGVARLTVRLRTRATRTVVVSRSLLRPARLPIRVVGMGDAQRR